MQIGRSYIGLGWVALVVGGSVCLGCAGSKEPRQDARQRRQPAATAPQPDPVTPSPSPAPVPPGPLAPAQPGPMSAPSPPSFPAAAPRFVKALPEPAEAAPQPMAAPPLPAPPPAAPPPWSVAPAAREPESAPPPPKLAAMAPETTGAAVPETAAVEAAKAPAGDYTVVKVFYGTDRAVEAGQSTGARVVGRLTVTLLAAGIAMILVAVAYRIYPARLLRGLALCGVAVSAVTALLTVYAAVQGSLLRDPGESGIGYGGERGVLQTGTCEVSIPKRHEVGELESPSVLRLEFRQDPVRHVVLLGVKPLAAEDFYADLRQCVDRSAGKAAFVFVHGYNVTFADAARRTAQIAYDLRFDGAPIFYSWPSQGKLAEYTVDETNVEWTAPHLRAFLTDVARRCGAQQVHLIAHSMGNRALTTALRGLSYLPAETRPAFHEVLLTAPDIDADIFRHDIAPRIVQTARRVTLYASSNDKALAYSKTVHGYPRAGDSGQELVVTPGVDTIDVSAIDTSLLDLGHSYYGSNDTVLADMLDLIRADTPPDQRRWLRPQQIGNMTYWIFQCQ